MKTTYDGLHLDIYGYIHVQHTWIVLTLYVIGINSTVTNNVPNTLT